MSYYYLESSALLKLYVRERGTDDLVPLVRNPFLVDRFIVLSLASVEVRSAIRRRERIGDIAAPMAAAAIRRLEWQVGTRFYETRLDGEVIEVAKSLIDRHGLRAYDSLQLAGCLAIREFLPTFVCSDQKLLKAADEEGLATFNPEMPVPPLECL